MKFLRSLLILGLIAFSINGCTGDFEELNTRPDALIAANLDASLLGQGFARAQFASMHGAPIGSFQLSQSLFADIYAQYFATTAANFDSDRYVEVGRWINGSWNNFYSNSATGIKFVEDFSAENNLPVEGALTKIWKVQAYHRMTDYYGPIIYSQFGNGETTVPYDTQESIYRSFFVTLDEAVAVLNANRGGNAFGSNDLLYAGDVDKWIVYANSLRLRLAMRVRYADPALAKAEAEKAVNDGVMLSNADNASLLTNANSFNDYNRITNWGEFRMSALMESILVGYDDPRLPEYFSPAANGDQDADGNPYEGLRNGQAKVDKVPAYNTNHSDMGPKYLPANVGTGGPRLAVMDCAEMYFLRAEGALVGWNMDGTAKDLYEEGIRQSMMEHTSADAAAIDAYIASGATPKAVGDVWNTPASSDIPVKFEEAGDQERQLEQIITQKWISLYPDSWEAFAELRRTGYPKIIPLLFSDNQEGLGPNDIFRRLSFVDGEFSNNREAVEAAIQLPEIQSRGGDKNSTHVWWDAK